MDRVSSMALRLRALIPETYDGQHFKTAEVLCDPSRAWPREEIMVQLFLLANNFIFQRKIKSPTLQSLSDHDERIAALLAQLAQIGPQDIKAFLSAQNPTVEAIKEQLFASILRSEDTAMLQLILTTGVNVNTVIGGSTDGVPISPLVSAARIQHSNKSLRIIRLLIDAGADVNFHYGLRSALVAATEKGHVDVVRILLEKGARTCTKSLEYAINSGRDELLQLILDAGANVNSTFYPWGYRITSIGLAVLKGHVEIARMLITEGADVNAMQFCKCMVSSSCVKDHDITAKTMIATTALGLALSKGHLDMAQVLLERTDVGINHLSVNQYVSPLLVACDRGYTDIIAKLLDAGVDVCAADAAGMALNCRRTTLISAMIRGQDGKINMDLCEVLISKGARLGHALLEAARSGNPELVTFLLNRSSGSSASDLGFEETPLGCAIEEGSVDVAELLYDAGFADAGSPRCIKNAAMFDFLHRTKLLPGILRANGQTIFCNAVREQRRRLLERLVAHDEYIDFSQEPKLSRADSEPLVQLDNAVQFGSPELIKYLLGRGATFGRLTLRLAMQHEEPEDILHALLSSLPPTWGPEDIEPQDGPVGWRHSDTKDPPALIRAAQLGDSSMLHTLLAAVNWGSQRTGKALTAAISSGNYNLARDLRCVGASLEEALFSDYWLPDHVSALGAAVEQENVELVADLINAGSDVNKPAGDGSMARTALQRAAEIGHLKLVDILLDANADVNAPPAPKRGATALQCAAIGGHLEIAHRLLRAGANINAEGSKRDGRTALEGAVEHGRLEMVHFLLERGARIRGVYKCQYDQAVELAKYNGHNATAKYLKSVYLSRAERKDENDDDDYSPVSQGEVIGENSAFASDELECEQEDEERNTPGPAAPPALAPVLGSRMLSEGEALQENMRAGRLAGVGGEHWPPWGNDTCDAMPCVEPDVAVGLLDDSVMGEMIQWPGFDDGNQSQIHDDTLEFTEADALPTLVFEGAGWQTQLEPELDMMDIDLDGIDLDGFD